jgi:cell division septum initiation protein DivIVA
MSVAETGASHIPDQLVDQLAKGYDALAIELKRVHEQQQELENKLSWAKQQASHFPSYCTLHHRMIHKALDL